MKRLFLWLAGLFFILTTYGLQAANISPEEATAIAVEAYIYGYPLVTMDKTRQVMTNITAPQGYRAPMGHFVNTRKYPDASFRDVGAPNADTLYSAAWIDLSDGPYVLHVPDEHGRYYLIPIVDGWTTILADPGTRTTGTKAADYAIVGPGWNGNLPPNVKQYRAMTNMVWVIGRTYSTGTPEDYKVVHEIQDQYSLVPLSAYGTKNYIPPPGKVDPSIDMTTPVREQIKKLEAAEFFKTFAALLKSNPPTFIDGPIVAKMAKIGIVPGKDFDIGKIDPKIANAIQSAPKLAMEKIKSHEKVAEKKENGWVFTLKTGAYGVDYLQRAYVASISLGYNLPQDTIYPVTTVDIDGRPLTGANNYILHFPKGKAPPIEGFWSLTMYDKQYFFVDNPLNRYTLSPRDPLKYNKDGSLDLYIQHANPGRGKESNWLPAPKDDFVLMLRLYWPKESAINGTWVPPAVQKVQ